MRKIRSFVTCALTIIIGFATFTACGHQHNYVDVVTKPTCTEQGYTTHTCTCGDVVVDNYVKELGHNYVDIVTKPTYTERGYTTHICSCGDKYIDTYVDTLKYKIRLETNGGQCDTDCVEYDLGDSVVLPIPSKDELFFEGWFVDPDCKEKFNAAYYNNSNITILYAAFSSYDLSAYEFAEYANGWSVIAILEMKQKLLFQKFIKISLL